MIDTGHHLHFHTTQQAPSANFSVDGFDCIHHWDEERKAVVALLKAKHDIYVYIKAISMNISFTKCEVIQVGISCKIFSRTINFEGTECHWFQWFMNHSREYAVLLVPVE